MAHPRKAGKKKTAKPIQARGITRTAPVQIAAAAGEGNAKRTFSIIAYTGEPMSIWPWDQRVVIDLDTLDLSQQRIPALYDHYAHIDHVVGQVETLEVGPAGLVASGFFTPSSGEDPAQDYCAKVLSKADSGYQWQASVGGNPATVDEVKAGESIKVNGRDYTGPCYVARGVQLREISFVVLGGDRKTSAVVARNSLKGTSMKFEDWLLTLGFDDASTLSEVQKANLMQKFQEEYPDSGEATTTTTAAEGEGEDDEEETPPAPANAAANPPRIKGSKKPNVIAARRRREAAEVERIDEIRRVCASADNPTLSLGSGAAVRQVSIAAHAIAQGWSANETRREVELQQLRASRAQGPFPIIHGHDRDCTMQGLQGAMILRAGGRLDHPAYQSQRAVAVGLPAWLRMSINAEQRQQAMEAAHRYSQLSAADLCREAIRLDGKDAPLNRQDMIRAAFSGSSLSNIFTTNVNAVLIATYMEAPDTTATWTQETDVNDFKTQDEIQLQKGSGLTKLPRGGEADHANRADKVESYKISRYANQFQIDEQDIIDDNLSAFSDIPLEMGNAAARLRPDLVYSIVLDNPALTASGRDLFNATDGNLDTTAALAIATLKAAVSAMMLFQQNGVNLNIKATHLIVPPTLIYTARELVQSATVIVARGGSTDTTVERGTLNTLQADQLQIVSDARLENGVTDPDSGTTHSGSTSTWYLASTMVRTIKVAYLAGTGRSPQVRPFTLDKGKWGLGWDIKMDIGAKAMDWRGMHKATA
jgi:hypothetical protein